MRSDQQYCEHSNPRPLHRCRQVQGFPDKTDHRARTRNFHLVRVLARQQPTVALLVQPLQAAIRDRHVGRRTSCPPGLHILAQHSTAIATLVSFNQRRTQVPIALPCDPQSVRLTAQPAIVLSSQPWGCVLQCVSSSASPPVRLARALGLVVQSSATRCAAAVTECAVAGLPAAGSTVAASATNPDPVQPPRPAVQQPSTDRSHRTPPAPPHQSDPSSLPCPLAAQYSMAIPLHRHNHGPADRAAVKSQPATLRSRPSAQHHQSTSERSPVVQSTPSVSDGTGSSEPRQSAGPTPNRDTGHRRHQPQHQTTCLLIDAS